jgi:sugar lactone lactonase YvrE
MRHVPVGPAVLVLLGMALAPIPAQTVTIPPDTVTTVVDGDSLPAFGAVGGIAIDGLGYIYAANFRNEVWRYTPGGAVELFARGMYGASGNAIGRRGELYQSSFTGHFVSRVARDGTVETYADTGLNGPVGIAVGEDDELYVVNCSGNTVSRIATDRSVHRFADGPLFACPNGITRDDRGDLYVVNFGSTQVIRITPAGTATVFADIPGAGGNGHIAFGRDGFYVTKFRGHQVFRLERDRSSRAIAGTGTQGHRDGPAATALLSQPNGIAISPGGAELWVNELISGSGVSGGEAHAVLRRIRLVGLGDVLIAAPPGIDGMTAAYRAYRAARPGEGTAAAAISHAYQYLSGQRVPEALALFRLNADDHPADPTSQYQLGEAYRFTGQPALATAQYRRVLALDPGHALASQRLAALDDGT